MADNLPTAEGSTPRSPGLYVIVDGPPGPESGRFVELEDEHGHGVGPDQSGARWTEEANGLWRLGPFDRAPLPLGRDIWRVDVTYREPDGGRVVSTATVPGFLVRSAYVRRMPLEEATDRLIAEVLARSERARRG